MHQLPQHLLFPISDNLMKSLSKLNTDCYFRKKYTYLKKNFHDRIVSEGIKLRIFWKGIHSEPIRIIPKSVSEPSREKVSISFYANHFKINLTLSELIRDLGPNQSKKRFHSRLVHTTWSRFIRIEVSDWVGLISKWFVSKEIENFFRILVRV